MTTHRFEIYAPLQNFHWSGDSLELASGLWVKRFKQMPNLCGLDRWLAEDERRNIQGVTHWLTFEWNEGSDVSPTEIVNLFLLSLWLVKPTSTHIGFWFQIDAEPKADYQRCKRLHERFAFLPGEELRKFEEPDLQIAASFYSTLHTLHCARGRLNDALLFTIAGCRSEEWQVALICHSAAAEALLTYRIGHGITRRLSTTYACLIETHNDKRDVAFKEFKQLYSARSDVMHGRTHNVQAADRLTTLEAFQSALRRLWSAVLLSPPLIEALEGNDTQRQTHFQAQQLGYTAPPRQMESATNGTTLMKKPLIT